MNDTPTVALSIRQPWAHLIVTGIKPVENRSWATSFRGPIWIHAGKQLDDDDVEDATLLARSLGITLPKWFNRGGIVGQATITDCVRKLDSPWFYGKFGFVLKDAKPCEFRPAKGKLGFFKVEAS